MPSFPTPSRWLCLFAAGLLGLAGCEQDKIDTYTVRRPAPEVVEEKVRLLAAILDDGPNQWIFKLAGPIEDVSKNAEAFKTFVQSVRFTGKADNPVEWKTPDSWEKGPPKQFGFATFFLGPKGKAPELTIFKFGKQDLLDNVNRWCKRDLGRRPIRDAELPAYLTKVRAGDHEGVLVDMTGPQAPGAAGGKAPPMDEIHGGGRPMDDIHGKAPRPQKLPITYTAPAGWEETGPRSVMGIVIVTSFRISDGDRKAEVQVTPLPGMAGGLLGNINRWRGQVGLPGITQDQLDKDPPRTIRVGGENSPYYDFVGPDQRMLLATVKRGRQMWYFKMLGSADLVGKNKSKFESFVQSVKFTGAADE